MAWLSRPARLSTRCTRRAPISAIEAARANAQAIALMLAEVGVTVDCLPLLDVSQPDTTEAITDTGARIRADARRARWAGRSSRGCATAAWSVWSKHMPGHGRAKVDTHYHLPTVTRRMPELEIDLAPFRALADAPMGMTSHIVFEAWDPERPATLSPIVIEEVIREAHRLRRPVDDRRYRHEGADRHARATRRRARSPPGATWCSIAGGGWTRWRTSRRGSARCRRGRWSGSTGRWRRSPAARRRARWPNLIAKRDALLALA